MVKIFTTGVIRATKNKFSIIGSLNGDSNGFAEALANKDAITCN